MSAVSGLQIQGTRVELTHGNYTLKFTFFLFQPTRIRTLRVNPGMSKDQQAQPSAQASRADHLSNVAMPLQHFGTKLASPQRAGNLPTCLYN
ncbi:hypothetical protein Tco_0240170, partial [Tanacetum coccineum]